MIPKSAQAFTRDEYLRRLAGLKTEMSQRGIDVVVINEPSNITYLTGYSAQSGYVPQGVIVSLDVEEPTYILRRCDSMAALHQVFMSRDNVIGYAESLVGNPTENGWDAVIDFLLETGVGDRAVGLEMAILQTPDVEKFRRRLPSATLNDVTSVVTWLRIVKSDAEIAVMREAGAITDAAIARSAEVLRPGVRESDAAAEIISTLIKGVDGSPGTSLAEFFLCASPRISTPHIPWTGEVLQKGSQINLEFGGKRHSYVTPIMRTFVLGEPSDRLRKYHEAEVAGLEAALAIVEPGRTCGDVAEAFYRTAESFGVTKDTRCGYAVGIDWLEPTASLKVGDPTVLEPNMTFHLMLGNWPDEDFGYAISQSFRVTESGVERLTKTPTDLYVIN